MDLGGGICSGPGSFYVTRVSMRISIVLAIPLLLGSCGESKETEASILEFNKLLLVVEQSAKELKAEAKAQDELLAKIKADQEAISKEREEYRALADEHMKLQHAHRKLERSTRSVREAYTHTQWGLRGAECARVRLVMEKLRERVPDDAFTKVEKIEYELMIELLRKFTKDPAKEQ